VIQRLSFVHSQQLWEERFGEEGQYTVPVSRLIISSWEAIQVIEIVHLYTVFSLKFKDGIQGLMEWLKW
jgi:hypothetical protein